MAAAVVPSYGGVELRKLPLSIKIRLGQLLDIQESWKILMAFIPSEKNSNSAKYTTEHMLLVERHGRLTGKSCGEIFIDEWSTSGKCRPTTETLLDLLIKCELYRAADYVATQVLIIDPPERPVVGPAAKIPSLTEEFSDRSRSVYTMQTTLEAECAQSEDRFKDILEQINNQDSDSGHLINFNANVLESATNGFEESSKIGSGAFGEVYKLDLSKWGGPVLAVKALHLSGGVSMMEDQFLTEIRVLSAYRHENLVPLIGFCSSAPRFCLIYEFMPRGSLLQAIACEEEGVQPLSWNSRLKIIYGIVKGIRFLHYGKEKPLIHRDIKSANVLLDNRLVPKLGDFGLAKSLTSSNGTSALTSTIIGTSAYMAPEAFRGDISPKMDIFSFGVILLELITGLPPYDEDRDGNDIVTFIEDAIEDDDIVPFVDQKAGEVNSDEVKLVYLLSQKCLDDKKRRLTSERVVQELDYILTLTDSSH